MLDPVLQTVLSRYPALGHIERAERLAGGFSGDETWKITSTTGVWVLKRISLTVENRSPWEWRLKVLARIGWGEALLPKPLKTASGELLQEVGEKLCFILSWIPGEPLLLREPTRERLEMAAAALARAHRMLVNGQNSATMLELELFGIIPQGLLERRDLLRITLSEIEVYETEARKVESWLRDFALRTIARVQKFGPGLLSRLDGMIAKCMVEKPANFPCLRDVRPEHVMYVDRQGRESVSGFIDLGAMRIDSPMADLSRLLQEWKLTRPDWFASALAAYDRRRSLSEFERKLIDAYDRSSRLLSCVNWVQWLLIDRTTFPEMPVVQTRLRRLEELCVEVYGA